MRYRVWFANGWTYNGGPGWSLDKTLRRAREISTRHMDGEPRVIAVVGFSS